MFECDWWIKTINKLMKTAIKLKQINLYICRYSVNDDCELSTELSDQTYASEESRRTEKG